MSSEVRARNREQQNAIDPDERPYLCDDEVTITDFFGVAIVTPGEWVGVDLSPYPNIQRWVSTMKRRSSWSIANAAHEEFVTSLQDNRFVALA